MRYAYLDPSAWAKRYYQESGTDLTNLLFDNLLKPHPSRLLCSRVGISEVTSVLNRHRNAGRATQAIFNMAYGRFEAESRAMRLLPVRTYQIDSSIRLLLAHNLNATDALHLQVALELLAHLHSQGDSLLFFSADQRLLRAAQTEGLVVFNPETGAKAQLESLLGT